MKKEIKNLLKKYNAENVFFFYNTEEDQDLYGRNSKNYKTKKNCFLIVNFSINKNNYSYTILSVEDFKNNINYLIN